MNGFGIVDIGLASEDYDLQLQIIYTVHSSYLTENIVCLIIGRPIGDCDIGKWLFVVKIHR
jgi:hypothetical protein